MIKTFVVENKQDLIRCQEEGLDIIAHCENEDGSFTIIYKEED